MEHEHPRFPLRDSIEQLWNQWNSAVRIIIEELPQLLSFVSDIRYAVHNFYMTISLSHAKLL